jgi:hypothetical protein
MASGGEWERAIIRKRSEEYYGVPSVVYEVTIKTTPVPAPGPEPGETTAQPPAKKGRG